MSASSRIAWSEPEIRRLASQCSSRTEFSKKYRGGYRAASLISGLLDELFGNHKLVWNEHSLRVEAAKYTTKSDFQRGSGGAYIACLKRFPHILNDTFNNSIRYWKDEQSVRTEAERYSSRTAFMRGSSGAYKAAASKFPHILVALFGESSNSPYTRDELLDLARQCSSRFEFRRRFGGAYAVACYQFPDVLDEALPLIYSYWSDESDVRKEASKYLTKSEFVRGSVSAYQSALRMGIIDDLGFVEGACGFQTTKPAYLYITELSLKNGERSVMFGITNNLPSKRYRRREQSHMGDRLAFMFNKGSTALSIETALKRKTKGSHVPAGASPLFEKSGTSGEIVVGYSLPDLVTFISGLADSARRTDWRGQLLE